MDRKFSVPELLASNAEKMYVDFRQKLIPHPGELGVGREEIVRDFLRKHLPKRLECSSGFVFDARGETSGQMDLIVYDCTDCPKFEAIGGKTFFPCEAVVCAGQIKSAVTSQQQFRDALNNLRSVKALDRSGEGTNFDLSNGRPIDHRRNHVDQIFTFAFVIERCIKMELIRKALFEYMAENERCLWPNITYSFDNFLMTFSCESGVCPNPMDAFAISVSKDLPNSELLLYFCRLLTRAMHVTTVSSFSYANYLKHPKEWPFETYAFQDAPVKGKLPDHLLLRDKPDCAQGSGRDI